MLLRRKSIRSVLFLTYSVIIVLILSVTLLAFYLWSADTLRSRAFDTISGTAQSVKEKLDLEMQKMDTVSQNILYSNLVKDRFLVLSGRSGEDTSAEDSVRNAKELAEILVAANGPALPVQQVNLYDFAGHLFASGFDNRRMTVNLEDKPWYRDVMSGELGKVITTPEPDEQLQHVVPTREDAYSVSLLRVFTDKYNTPEGIVEVKQSVGNLFKTIVRSQREGVILYNDEGRLIYPAGPGHETELAYVAKLVAHPGGGRIDHPDTGERQLYAVSHSEFTGWNAAVILSERSLFAPLRTFTAAFAALAAALLLLALALAYVAAQRITKPIVRMQELIKSTNLDSLAAPIPIERTASGLNELDRLQLAFAKMGERLKFSMEQLMLAQRQELQARMLALQSQMNPHFLYNTLATIGVMAEENMNREIGVMVENLSDMLRYISADDGPTVELGTELTHTEQYLRGIGLRFGSRLAFRIDADAAARAVHVPKLIVQPLVENAIKYCTTAPPPWTVDVRAYTEGDRWFAAVRDNGPGFDERSLRTFEEAVDAMNRTGQPPNLEVNRMGLLNLYIRLKMLYGAKMTFRIERAPDGGSIVTIGGTQSIGGD